MRKTTFFGKMWLVAGIFCLISGTIHAAELSAIATLTYVVGKVEVELSKNQKRTVARNGLLLYERDRVITGEEGKVTVLFRDGSEIRLFANSQFTIEAGEELPAQKRSFKYKLFMKLGSFWGKFIKGRQETEIATPTATIGVKGTSLRLTETATNSSVGLTEGVISVKNDASEFELLPGKQLKEFTKTDQLSEKVADIPYTLFIKPDKYQLEFKDNMPETIRLQIQMGDAISKQDVKRPGSLYLRSNYQRIVFPPEVALNEDGSARFTLKIEPPQTSDQDFEGKILIWAVVDDSSANDVGEGSMMLQVAKPAAPKKRSIKIDANSGNVIPK